MSDNPSDFFTLKQFLVLSELPQQLSPKILNRTLQPKERGPTTRKSSKHKD